MPVRNPLQVLYSPRTFYRSVCKTLDIRTEVTYLIILCVTIFAFWFVRVLFLINKPEVKDAGTEVYRLVFSGGTQRTLTVFGQYLILDLLILGVSVVALAVLSMGIARLFSIKKPFKGFFAISTYAIVPYILSVFIYWVLTTANRAEWQIYVSAVSYLWVAILVIIGVRILSSEGVNGASKAH